MKACYTVLLLCCCYAMQCLAKPQLLPFTNFDNLPLPSLDMANIDLKMMPDLEKDGKVNKTTKKEKLQDGTEITTTNIDGPNFKVHEESAFNSAGSKASGKFGKLSAFGPMLLGGFPMLGGRMNLKKMFEKKELKCKSCKETEFCDSEFGECRKRLEAGIDCQSNLQCKSGLMCVWGLCNKAQKGDAGTSCNATTDCGKEMNCLNLFYARDGEKYCLPKLSEGAACSSSPFTDPPKDNPCAEGLKCAIVGASDNKLCVDSSFKEPDLLNEDKESDENSGDDDDDEDDDDGDESIPVKTADGKKIPGTSNKNKGKKQQKQKKSTGKEKVKQQQQQKKNSGKSDNKNSKHLKFSG